MTALHPRTKTHHIPAFPAIERDPTGAGDVFAATLFSRLRETGDPFEAARFASYVAARSVEGAGISGIPAPDEIEQALAIQFDTRETTVGSEHI